MKVHKYSLSGVRGVCVCVCVCVCVHKKRRKDRAILTGVLRGLECAQKRM